MSGQKCGPTSLSVPDTATFTPPDGSSMIQSCKANSNAGESKKEEVSRQISKCNPGFDPVRSKPEGEGCGGESPEEKKKRCEEKCKEKNFEDAKAASASASEQAQGKCATLRCSGGKQGKGDTSSAKADDEKCPESWDKDKGGREYGNCNRRIPTTVPSVCGCGNGEGSFCGPNVSCEIKPLKMKKRPVTAKLD